MLIIILGLIFGGLFLWLSEGKNLTQRGKRLLRTLAVVTVMSAIMLGAFYPWPISDYNEWEKVKETELVVLSDSEDTGIIYVSCKRNNRYTYRFETDSEFDTETLIGENVEEIEDPNCEIPILYEYERSGKVFAIRKQTKYVFYVPEGTISKEVKIE